MMPFYPVPALVALAGWIFILGTSGAIYVLSGFALVALGIVAYLMRARHACEWPWERGAIAGGNEKD